MVGAGQHFQQEADTPLRLFEDNPKQRVDYPISAWPGVLVAPTAGSVSGLHPAGDAKLRGCSVRAALESPSSRRTWIGGDTAEAAEIMRAQIRVSPLPAAGKRGHWGQLEGSRMKGEESKAFGNTIPADPVDDSSRQS